MTKDDRKAPPTPFRDLTYEQQVRIAARLPKIADMIERELTKATGTRVGFSLLTWGSGRSQYVANCKREDVKKAMRELVDRWDRPGEDLGIPTLKDLQ